MHTHAGLSAEEPLDFGLVHPGGSTSSKGQRKHPIDFCFFILSNQICNRTEPKQHAAL